jgi:hypothetical protein
MASNSTDSTMPMVVKMAMVEQAINIHLTSVPPGCGRASLGADQPRRQEQPDHGHGQHHRPGRQWLMYCSAGSDRRRPAWSGRSAGDDVAADQVADVVDHQIDAVRRQGGQFRGQSGDHDVGDDVAFERLPAAENDQGGQTAPQGRQHAVIGWAGVQLVYFAHAAGNGHGAAPAQIISGR